MDKIDFGVIGNYTNLLHTDKMDIGRGTQVPNPDGTTGETSPVVPLYQDVPCHIAYKVVDNPDFGAVDAKPVITSFSIHCAVDIDLQKGDYVTAKKLDNDGNVLETYEGLVGTPKVSQGGKMVELEMRKGV